MPLHNLKLFSLLLFLLSPLASAYSDLFDSWCARHGKVYASEQEKLARFRAFQDNLAFVEQHNSNKNSSYALGLNAFADLTHHEFRSARLGLSAGLEVLPPWRAANRSLFLGSDKAVPDSIDWREKGAVTKVKDQGSCDPKDWNEGVELSIEDLASRISPTNSKTWGSMRRTNNILWKT